MKRPLLFDEMYDGKDEELQKLGYEAYSVKKLREEGNNLASDYSIVKFAADESMVLITEDMENKVGCDENKISCIQLGQNPSRDDIVEKLKEIEQKSRFSSRRAKWVSTIAIVAAWSLFLWFWLSFHIIESFINQPYSAREVIVAIASSALGLLFIFLKKFPSLDKKLLESYEILMFIITPTALSFPLFPDGDWKFAYILIIYFSAIMIWFGVSFSLVSRGSYAVSKGKRNRLTRSYILLFWVYLLAIGCLLVYTFQVYSPKIH